MKTTNKPAPKKPAVKKPVPKKAVTNKPAPKEPVKPAKKPVRKAVPVKAKAAPKKAASKQEKKPVIKSELYKDLSRDNPKHGKVFRFIDEYPIDLNATQAAIRAGYSPKTANEQSAQLLANLSIKKLVDEKLAEIAERNKVDQDYAVQAWKSAYEAKFTDFANIAIVCCRFCHGEKHKYQFTPNEYETEKNLFDENERVKLAINKEYLIMDFDEKGGIGFDARKKPHPDCPECFGGGKLILRINSTEDMTDETLKNLKGFKRIKGDYEIVLMDKEKALDALSRFVGLYEKDNKLTFQTPDNKELATYWEVMERARARQRAIDIERGNIVD